jgi:hypothetical protein
VSAPARVAAADPAADSLRADLARARAAAEQARRGRGLGALADDSRIGEAEMRRGEDDDGATRAAQNAYERQLWGE